MALLRVLLLAAHLLVMNLASAGPLVCLWLRWRGRRGDAAADDVGRRLAWWSFGALAVGVVVGFGLLGLAWVGGDSAYLQAVERFPKGALANIVAETLFSLVCLGIYAGTWQRWRWRPWLHGLWAVLADTNLLYHFPPLMVGMRQLAARPELIVDDVVTRPLFRSLILLPEILSQSVHVALASVAVAGVALMLAARGEASHLIRSGARLTLGASVVQLFVGGWVLLALPIRVRNDVTGGSGLATALFALAIIGTLALLHSLGIAAIGETDVRLVRRCGALLLCVVVLMTGVLWLANVGESLAMLK